VADKNHQAGARRDSGDHQEEFNMRRERDKRLPCLRISRFLNDDRLGEGELPGRVIAATNAYESRLSSHRPTRNGRAIDKHRREAF
jgi:hypothetical protein